MRIAASLRLLGWLLPIAAAGGCGPAPDVLLFTGTAGYRHESIAAGRAAIERLGTERGFRVTATEDPGYLTEDSLARFRAVIFLHTTGEFLDRARQVDLQRFIQAGGGFVGVHAAADAEYDWRWYGRLVGGYFASHPAIQPARVVAPDPSHPMVRHLPADWRRADEWYNYRRMADSLTVILALDESSYRGGTQGEDHPITWYHEFDGGRAWYTGLGHTEESWAEPEFLRLLANGIRYAIGDGGPVDYGKARARRAPADPGLVRTVLTQGTLTEPTEMAILPGGDVLIAQRRGELLRYRASDRSLRQVGALPVYWKSGVKDVNAEEGLLGLAADPGFERNRFIYLYYSPADSAVNRLSRFVFDRDTLDRGTERVILEVRSDRQICCHTGGSIAFGPDGNLFLSTGDNANPFDDQSQRYRTHGFAPLDDRPGRSQYDARRSSANTNDLRGKIIRIRVEEDGRYTIPPGNLFPPGTAGTRPEIYAMGTRNAYRLSVDSRTGFVYWGDVGPDADQDSLDTRGPRGYDEINQARRPGFFGWPLFVGESYPYRPYDYATGRSGPPFDPARPVNDSRNNTGLRELPPTQPPFIWYPYGDSPDFPQVGKGGRTALAGPVYHAGRHSGGAGLPEYYDGKLFVYDWIRHWIMAVTLAPSGDYEAMEPFLAAEKFAAPVDLELGPDGSLYVLEYGIGWFTKNPDAKLSRVGRAEGASAR